MTSSTSNDNKKNNKNGKHHHHHHHATESWDTKMTTNINQPAKKCRRHSSTTTTNTAASGGHGNKRSESVISTDSDIRFTRRKLGDSQRCGCAVIAGFLVLLLLGGAAVYVGYTYFRPDPLPERIFRAKLRVIHGDSWSPDLADQNSMRFQYKSRDYRERINLVIRRSDLRESYDGSEVLALDGTERENDLIIHFNLRFDPYRGLVSTADLYAIFLEEINKKNDSRYFKNITLDGNNFEIKELLGQLDDIPVSTASPLGDDTFETNIINTQSTTVPKRRCEPVRLPYCKMIGYNTTTYPNLLGHYSIDEVIADVISFRELVDAECFRQAFDFVCRLLQPPCMLREPLEPTYGKICRDYCQAFWMGCGNRLPIKFKKYFDCEKFPESTGIQSCRSKPDCVNELETNALSGRLCDGIADCPDLTDELTCSYCPRNALYCGRGRACVSRYLRCDGKSDCPDGSDEKDCLSIAPMVSQLTNPEQMIPHRQQFYSEGFAVFSEKGRIGKLCAEGLDTPNDLTFRNTVAESLCKSLGYEKLNYAEIKNDTEPNQNYVRVLDPSSQEISFVRTECLKKMALYVSCSNLECGIQSFSITKHTATTLPKMATPGDWPWFVALFRDERHVCDGTLLAADWVLTTESCFQGQPKATWIAVFGLIRLNSQAPWVQRRRIIGMVKSPVEGSTAALIRLETPVTYSDFIRPICLPDYLTMDKKSIESILPYAEKLNSNGFFASVGEATDNNDGGLLLSKRSPSIARTFSEYFKTPVMNNNQEDEVSGVGGDGGGGHSKEYIAKFIDELEQSPIAESYRQFENYPLPENANSQIIDNEQLTELNDTLVHQMYNNSKNSIITNNNNNRYAISKNLNKSQQQQQPQWINCNTLGWNLQRDQLQRIQLKIGNMAACENISIATKNSMCTEASYHRQDCTEEENAGSPMICMFPDTHRWALIGVSSWRIACAQTGVERPRMYDKITSNVAWIHETINAT